MFQEPHQFAEKNRKASANSKAKIARLANNELGTVIFYGRLVLTLTRDETITLAQQLVSSIDRIDERKNRTRKITRSYEEQEPYA